MIHELKGGVKHGLRQSFGVGVLSTWMVAADKVNRVSTLARRRSCVKLKLGKM